LKNCHAGLDLVAIGRLSFIPSAHRRVAGYLEEHLDENVPLTALAELARLSPFHFSRTIKQSFGLPPHRYLLSPRAASERAKVLLADNTPAPGRSA
jgi:AraC family transcriptional regulator